MTEDWTKWEGLVIDRVFPLRRFLGRSGHSVVFLTEHRAHELPDAAIKLIPAEPMLEEAQLSRWRIAAALSHPHLIRIFDSGRCRLGGHPFLFVVMEYAEQTLAQILPHRALTPDEVREMLLPALDALVFLHGKNLVQGQLKPPNVLVVDDRVKLSSDNVRPAGDSSAAIAESSAYDAPEAKDGRISAAADIWALGVTIVEALTRSPPTWPDERREIVSWPAALPEVFVGIVRRCLNRYPAGRPTIAELKVLIAGISQAPVASANETDMSQGPVSTPHTGNAAANEAHEPQIAVTSVIVAEATGAVTPATEAVVAALTEAATSQAAASGAAAKEPPRQATAAELPAAWRSSVRAIAVAALAVLAVVWIGWRLFHSHTDNLPRPASGNSQLASRQAASPPAFARNPAAPASAPASAAVLHRVIPDVPRHARESIRGRIKIMVRVTVDHSGNVVGERLVSSGSSRYFARLASEAAAKWKFAAADEQGSREWLLRFEFTRGGVTGQVAAPPT